MPVARTPVAVGNGKHLKNISRSGSASISVPQSCCPSFGHSLRMKLDVERHQSARICRRASGQGIVCS